MFSPAISSFSLQNLPLSFYARPSGVHIDMGFQYSFTGSYYTSRGASPLRGVEGRPLAVPATFAYFELQRTRFRTNHSGCSQKWAVSSGDCWRYQVRTH